MKRTPRRQLGHARTLLLLLMLVLGLTAMLAGPALAGPPAPILDLTQLQAKLAADGPLDGHMTTTMKGTTPVDIPVRVLAVVQGFAWGNLIMFESTDPAITDIGGIAAGMSGSPVYVDDGGVDKLVGAVSWGEDFSARGTGLATPIEYMTALQDQYAGSAAAPASARKTVTLSAPVQTSQGPVRRLVLAANSKTAAAVAPAAGQAVMHPLALAEIGGLSESSKAYQAIAAKLATGGLTVVPAQTSPMSGTAPTPDLEAGSPVGVLFSNGFYWIGVLGTVTYVDGPTALLMGHPILSDYSDFMLGAGPIDGQLTGAVVDGIWPSPAWPSKMMTPADVKGSVTQDRAAGVVAQIGGTAATFPVVTDATVNESSSHVVDTTDVGAWFATDYAPGVYDPYGSSAGAAGYVATAGLAHAAGSDAASGSAVTTTTVVASDGVSDYTITRHNLWDTNDGYDTLPALAADDVTMIVSALVSDPYGLRHVVLKSVSVSADLSSGHLNAGLVDVTMPRAPHIGANTVVVSYYRYGSPDLQTLTATVDIPAGTQLDGTLSVMSAATHNDYYSYSDGSSQPAPAPQTVAQVAAALDATPDNADLMVEFTPRGSEDDSSGDAPPASAQEIVPTDWVFAGDIEKDTTKVQILNASGGRTAPVVVLGMVPEATKDVDVSIYRQTAGTPEPSTPDQIVTASAAQGGMFVAVLPPTTHNEIVTAEAPPITADSLPGAARATIKVRAQLRLTTTFAHGRFVAVAHVSPKDPGGKVTFQRLSSGHWVTYATRDVTSLGVARATLAVKRPPRIRARFNGSVLNMASLWVIAR